MWQAIRVAFFDARIRSVAIALLLLGFTYASTIPYQSIIATEQLHMSEQAFGLIILAVGFSGMVGNIVLGSLSDTAKDRKTAVLWSLAAGAAGFGAFALLPSTISFLICLFVVMPISGSVYAQLFGTVRSMTNVMGPKEAGSINAVIRSFYAISWIVVPGLVGLFIATRTNVSDSFAVAALAFVLCLVFYWLFGPTIPGGVASGSSIAANLRQAVGLAFSPARLVRLVALAAINSVSPLSAAIVPLLIVKQIHGSLAEVGWFGGLVAALEIPIMLLIGAAARRFNLWIVMVAGGIVHMMFLLSLTFATTTTTLFAVAVLNAVGNGVLLTQHITYAQNLLPDRPGLGSALLSIVTLIARGFAAAAFAGLGSAYGISGVLVVGAAVCFLGCVALTLFDRSLGYKIITT